MKHNLARFVITVLSIFTLTFSAIGVTPARADSAPPDSTADEVYGQDGRFDTSSNAGANSTSLYAPGRIALDSSDGLYVADSDNNRVLYYPAGSTTATRVYGQGGDFTSNTANKGGISADSLSLPYGIALDISGNLYVTDINNNRVLYYPAGSTTATRVYGQGGSFTSNTANNGGVSADSINHPGGVGLDGDGNLYVADTSNRRVLYYPAGSITATRVYGQGGDFTSNITNKGGISADSLSDPMAVLMDGSGNLYVTDGTYLGNHRILYYPAGSTTATRVYGQGGSFTSNIENKGGISANSLSYPSAMALDAGGNLYVTDSGNNRILYYPADSTTATWVYGQGGSFTSNTPNHGGISANSLFLPQGVDLDSNGNLYVADTDNNRVLKYLSSAIPATPVITWADPANIVYGTPLSGTQLNASANTPGTFTYNPASGTVLNAGTHTLHVDFVPTDTVNFANASKDVSITVTKATPVITWANPANIVYGTALSATQLNAAANTSGAFTYTPASGAVLAVGTHTLHVEFVPTDTANFTNTSKDVSITVTQATPVITWADPANIVYGTALSGAQLNATADTSGAFTYSPVSGTVLDAGPHTLHVEFVPTDTTNFTNASKDVSITVTKATPVITWADPANIDQGTPLSDTQLNASADVPGTFIYSPDVGRFLSTGTHTLHVDFVPTDALNYANASKEVSLTVNDHVIFSDVPSDYWARLHIERLYLNQVTGGCANNPLQYCPTTNVNRAMMAVFVLRAAHGPDFTPPPATGTVFADVPADSFAAAWIEQLAAEGITSGCGSGNYCPNGPVTRAVMAVFIVRAKYGIDYTPPDATGEIFDDVPANGFAAAFIEKLAADGVTSGCGGGNYCPANFITRAEMAVFLVAAFNLP